MPKGDPTYEELLEQYQKDNKAFADSTLAQRHFDELNTLGQQHFQDRVSSPNVIIAGTDYGVLATDLWNADAKHMKGANKVAENLSALYDNSPYLDDPASSRRGSIKYPTQPISRGELLRRAEDPSRSLATSIARSGIDKLRGDDILDSYRSRYYEFPSPIKPVRPVRPSSVPPAVAPARNEERIPLMHRKSPTYGSIHKGTLDYAPQPTKIDPVINFPKATGRYSAGDFLESQGESGGYFNMGEGAGIEEQYAGGGPEKGVPSIEEQYGSAAEKRRYYGGWLDKPIAPRTGTMDRYDPLSIPDSFTNEELSRDKQTLDAINGTIKSLYNEKGHIKDEEFERWELLRARKDDYQGRIMNHPSNQIPINTKGTTWRKEIEKRKDSINDPALLFASMMDEGAEGDYLGYGTETLPFKYKSGYSGYNMMGLDSIGERVDEFIEKGYLSKDFKDRMGFRTVMNDHKDKQGNRDPQKRVSGSFSNVGDMVEAKAAYFKSAEDSVLRQQRKLKVKLSEEAKDYFTVASFNLGEAGARRMMEVYHEKGILENDKFFQDDATTDYRSKYGGHNFAKRRVGAAEILRQDDQFNWGDAGVSKYDDGGPEDGIMPDSFLENYVLPEAVPGDLLPDDRLSYKGEIPERGEITYPKSDARRGIDYVGNPNASHFSPNQLSIDGKQKATTEEYYRDIIGSELAGASLLKGAGTIGKTLGKEFAYQKAIYNSKTPQKLADSFLEMEASHYAKQPLKERIKHKINTAYRHNPWAWRPNESKFYRLLGDEGAADAKAFGELRASPSPESYMMNNTHNAGKVYFNKGMPMSTRYDPDLFMGYKGPYMAETSGINMFEESVKGGKRTYGTLAEAANFNDPRLKFYKEHWLQGFKEVPKGEIDGALSIPQKKYDMGGYESYFAPGGFEQGAYSYGTNSGTPTGDAGSGYSYQMPSFAPTNNPSLMDPGRYNNASVMPQGNTLYDKNKPPTGSGIDGGDIGGWAAAAAGAVNSFSAFGEDDPYSEYMPEEHAAFAPIQQTAGSVVSAIPIAGQFYQAGTSLASFSDSGRDDMRSKGNYAGAQAASFAGGFSSPSKSWFDLASDKESGVINTEQHVGAGILNTLLPGLGDAIVAEPARVQYAERAKGRQANIGGGFQRSTYQGGSGHSNTSRGMFAAHGGKENMKPSDLQDLDFLNQFRGDQHADPSNGISLRPGMPNSALVEDKEYRVGNPEQGEQPTIASDQKSLPGSELTVAGEISYLENKIKNDPTNPRHKKYLKDMTKQKVDMQEAMKEIERLGSPQAQGRQMYAALGGKENIKKYADGDPEDFAPYADPMMAATPYGEDWAGNTITPGEARYMQPPVFAPDGPIDPVTWYEGTPHDTSQYNTPNGPIYPSGVDEPIDPEGPAPVGDYDLTPEDEAAIEQMFKKDEDNTDPNKKGKGNSKPDYASIATSIVGGLAGSAGALAYLADNGRRATKQRFEPLRSDKFDNSHARRLAEQASRRAKYDMDMKGQGTPGNYIQNASQLAYASAGLKAQELSQNTQQTNSDRRYNLEGRRMIEDANLAHQGAADKAYYEAIGELGRNGQYMAAEAQLAQENKMKMDLLDEYFPNWGYTRNGGWKRSDLG